MGAGESLERHPGSPDQRARVVQQRRSCRRGRGAPVPARRRRLQPMLGLGGAASLGRRLGRQARIP